VSPSFRPHQRLVLRADSGFFDGALLEYLDQRGHGYLIKVKLRNLDALLAQQHWAPRAPSTGLGAVRVHPSGPRLVVPALLRRGALPREDAADTLQTELLPVVRYDAFCYVTSEPLSPWQAHRTYGQRATSETWIEEAKNQMGLAHCSASW
jgi:hypothetical protein